MKLRSGKTTAATAPPSHSSFPQAINTEVGRCSKRRKVKKVDNSSINLVPREVIFNLLLILPGKHVQEVVRYVCKQWYDIVSDPCFVRAHSQMHTTMSISMSTSVIIQSREKQHEVVYCADKLNVTNFKLPFPAIIQGSCNGLVLLCDVHRRLNLHLMNPLTRRIVSLPPMELLRLPLQPPYSVVYSLAVNSSGQYKVVQVLMHAYILGQPDRCEINVCTIGVDKAWRPIDLQHSLGISMTDPSIFVPITRHGRLIAGFLYWCHYLSLLLAMDVDTETFYRVNWPIDKIDCRFRSYFFSMGTALGLMTADVNEPGIWIFRKLTDVKSSEWTDIYRIDLDTIVTKVNNGKWTPDKYDRWGFNQLILVPVSLIDHELCFYGGFDDDNPGYCCLIHYNLANETFVSSSEFNMSYIDVFSYIHVPTLVSPKIPSK